MSVLRRFAPALVLCLGVVLRFTIQPQASRPLEMPLAGFPSDVAGFAQERELDVPETQRRLLAADALLHREYAAPDGQSLTLYIAYYGTQKKGRSIHSPRNCLPGSGWEPVTHDRLITRTVYGRTRINRYVIEHGSGGRALVYYWYQGRGRVAADEYAVKAELLRDAIVRRRTDEGLVRVVFPLSSRDDLATVDALAARTVPELIDTLAGYLPG